MRLPVAYRSLARPSSVLEPSHSPDGIATPKDNTRLLIVPNMFSMRNSPTKKAFENRIGIPNFAPRNHILILGAALHSNSASKDKHVHGLNPPNRQAWESALPHQHYSMGASIIMIFDEFQLSALSPRARLLQALHTFKCYARVDLLGFEPKASALQRRRSSN